MDFVKIEKEVWPKAEAHAIECLGANQCHPIMTDGPEASVVGDFVEGAFWAINSLRNEAGLAMFEHPESYPAPDWFNAAIDGATFEEDQTEPNTDGEAVSDSHQADTDTTSRGQVLKLIAELPAKGMFQNGTRFIKHGTAEFSMMGPAPLNCCVQVQLSVPAAHWIWDVALVALNNNK